VSSKATKVVGTGNGFATTMGGLRAPAHHLYVGNLSDFKSNQ
jgi:hypothetical protein